MKSPHYSDVPKDIDANLAFRSEIVRMAVDDESFRRDLWTMSARDPLFWINTFAWTFDPRKTPSVVPFVTWPYQDEGFAEIFDAINNHDLLIEKSRDMGASWMILTAFTHCWQFRDMQTFLMVSRIEDLVDKADESDCLFWKVDFLIHNQPRWMIPRFTRSKLRLLNEDNKSTITGASTTSETGRGGRKTAILLDEFAAVEDGYSMLSATRDATNARIFNSTPKGMGNAFYDLIAKKKIKALRFHWTKHPEKAAGLYYDAKGKARSPWYDYQHGRAAHPVEIAQELDIDYVGADFQFYDSAKVDEHIRLYARSPFVTGDLVYDDQSCRPIEFVENPRGLLKLWFFVDGSGKPPADMECAIGVDIAAGTGASNSSFSVGNRRTGEKVASLATPNMRPEQLARYCIALAHWFNGAQIVPESNGPGRNFIDACIEKGYLNLWYRTNETSIAKKITMIPGWHASKESKLALHGEYRRAMASGEFINRDVDSLEECKQIVFSPTGGVEHSRAANNIDPSGAKDNHADRPTADALCWKGMKEHVRPPNTNQEHRAGEGTLAHRRQLRHQREIAAAAW